MKQVCVDNHVLLWGLREVATDGQEEMIPRTKQFLKDCEETSTRILVPSVVLAELLTAIEPKYHALTTNLLEKGFSIAPFDAAAAQAFAKLWQQRKESGLVDRIRAEDGATRQELKADCMIVAIALVRKAEAIYSHDGKLRKFSDGLVPVLEVPRLQEQPGLPFEPR
jgi:predicted nucleic acid-binding protein